MIASVKGRPVWLLLSAVSVFVIAYAIFTAVKIETSLIEILKYYYNIIVGSTYVLRDDVVGAIEVKSLRVPAAYVTGAGLAVAGAVYQGLFRNPLVSPDILGVSAGGGFSAAFGIYVMSANKHILSVVPLAFFGALFAVAIVYGVASLLKHTPSRVHFILVGIAIGSLFAAGKTYIELNFGNEDLLSLLYFLIGGFYRIDQIGRFELSIVLSAMTLCLAMIYIFRWHLNALAMGEEEAKTFGLNTALLIGAFIAAATLITAAAVSIAGIMGWVGLLVPHFARLLVGPEASRLIPMSFLLGGNFVVIADWANRQAFPLTERPLGMVIAFVGAPLFLLLLAVRRRHDW